MNLEDQNQKAEVGGHKSENNVNNSRRSFSKKGLIAPVVLTLANRSAWGANACIGTGFQSYAAAVANGQNLSHAAPDLSATAGWKSPRSGLPDGSTNGWADDANLSSWPSGVVPVRHRLTGNTSRYQRWSSSTNNWIDESRTEAVIRSITTTAFVDELLGGSPTGQTIYEAMRDSTTTLAYECATAINMQVKSLSPLPIFTSENDYALFYSNCINYS